MVLLHWPRQPEQEVYQSEIVALHHLHGVITVVVNLDVHLLYSRQPRHRQDRQTCPAQGGEFLFLEASERKRDGVRLLVILG